MQNVLYVQVTLQGSCFLCDGLLLDLYINTCLYSLVNSGREGWRASN